MQARRPALARRNRPLVRFVFRRIAALVFLLFGITLVAFGLTELVPGDPVTANLGQQALGNPEAVQAFRHHYGLDKPDPIQYAIYLKRLVSGDLGESEQSHRPVTKDLGEFIPATAELAITSTLIAFAVGLFLGVLAAMHRNGVFDQVLRVLSLAGVSMPTFWLGLVALYVVFFRLGWLPGNGRLDPGETRPSHVTGAYTFDALVTGKWSLFMSAVRHLVLPACVLAAYSIGVVTRFTRSAVLEVIHNDYVLAAHAKGLPPRIVMTRHVFRAALPSIITVLGLVFAYVMTGTVLVESIFSWPGIGQYAFRSATTLDLPAIIGVSLFVALVYILVNFVVDILYGVIDPRLRLS